MSHAREPRVSVEDRVGVEDVEALLGHLEHFGLKLGLERIRALLAELGDPQLQVPTVLVAGTNGKGSTASLLASIATHAGYRTGLFTSPHLESPTERLRVDGRALGLDTLYHLLRRVVDTGERLHGDAPTYFESFTAAGYLHFAETKLDLAVMEVGLGGRLDATNAGDPRLSLITEIDLDHRKQLGDTHAAVAREKAGILRPGRPALAWSQHPEAVAELQRCADAVGTDFELVSNRVEILRATDDGNFRIRTDLDTYDVQLRLSGRHQAGNMSLAIRAAETLRQLGWKNFDSAAILRGAAACRWPGRLEWIDLPHGASPGQPQKQRVLLDAAHNAHAAEHLGRFLRDLQQPYDLLFGAVRDKPAESMLPLLAQGATRVVLTNPDSVRARPAAELLPLLATSEHELVVEENLSRALDVALQSERPLVACGSIYLIGTVRRLLRERFGVPAAADQTPLC